MRRLRLSGAPVEVTTFVLGTDDEAADIVVVNGLWQMITHPGFRRADVAVFEFGIYYELFDSAFLLPSERVVATFADVRPARPGGQLGAGRGGAGTHPEAQPGPRRPGDL